MQKDQIELPNEIASYYAEKLAQHGQTPHGVDWNGEESQSRRFEQVCKIIGDGTGNFSLNDLGCGYGALFSFLSDKYPISSYLGVDVCEDMVRAAKSDHAANTTARFITAMEPDTVADYGVANGIFNLRFGRNDSEWSEHVQSTLDVLDRTSRLGFAFNCLTSYSDEDKKRDDLYYADPCKLFDLCKVRYSSQVALLHDYGLFDFTILVRKI